MTKSGTQEKPRRREGIHPGWDAAMEAARVDVPKKYPWIQAIIDTQPKVYIGAWWKLAELWELLRAVRPASILELGSGLTTSVFDRYLRSSDAYFHTIDENEDYQSEVVGRLGPLSRCHRRVLRKWVREDAKECQYVWPRYMSPFELVYVDGPDTSKCPDFVGVDAQLLIGAAKSPRWFVFDQRHKSVEAFWKVAKGRYVAHWDCRLPVLRGAPWWLAGLRYHTVFEKVLDS